MSADEVSRSQGRTRCLGHSFAAAGWQLGLALGAVCVRLGHAPLLARHFSQMLARPHYQFVVLVAFAALMLAWHKRRRVGESARVSSFSAYLLAGGAWLWLLMATVLDSPFLGAISLLWTLAAVAYGWGGTAAMRAFSPVWLMLWTIIPLPLAWHLSQMKPPNLPRALGLIDVVVKRWPAISSCRDTRGQILAKMERWDEALVDLEAALPAMPQNLKLHLALADVLG
jgi:hypothetical protein